MTRNENMGILSQAKRLVAGVRRWLLGSIRTATRQLVPSLPVLLLLASIAAVIVANVRVTAIP